MKTLKENLASGTLAATATACWLSLWVAGCSVTQPDSTPRERVTTIDIREDKPAEVADGEVKAMPAPPMQSVIVTASPGYVNASPPAMRREAYVRPVMVATDPGNERYNGKDVSAVRAW